MHRLHIMALSFMLGLASVCTASSASAATIIATLNSVGSGSTITMNAIRPNGTPFASQVLNGRATFTRTGGTDTQQLEGSGNSFFAFCVEPYEDATLNSTYTYTVDPLAQAGKSSISGGIGVGKALQISQLFGQFAPNLSAPMTAVQASALQIALWEIVSESSSNPFDVTSGTTYFSTPASSNFSQVIAQAQTYLNYVSTANGSAPLAQGLQALTVAGKQDFLVQAVIVAPEPGTWMMLILGFGLVGHSLRRRTRPVIPFGTLSRS